LATDSKSAFTHNDYTVGWICALEVELTASEGILDKEHPPLPRVANDPNTYTLGQVGQYNVTIACLPAGELGTSAAATAANNLRRSFPQVRFALMVGIGGGAPGEPNDDPRKDIRLGDVVVSKPEGTYGRKENSFH
jgi:nucleoside phosphorylase